MATTTPPHSPRRAFADYWSDAEHWITLSTGAFYPDILTDACHLYEPVLRLFEQLLRSSESSTRLFLNTTGYPKWMRVQLARVFRKYVSPDIPVEMLRVKGAAAKTCDKFGHRFRKIHEVQKAFASRPMPDEALCALLWEYKDRGKKGYDLTESLFPLLRARLCKCTVKGPERAGKDIPLGAILLDYPKKDRPVDFVISYDSTPVAIGLARYDSDRGGAQEDDRTGGYRDCAHEILSYATQKNLKLKVIFVNDGPGLLLGSMWQDYVALERLDPSRVRVVTLRMVADRITEDWLLS